jgi:hypothetical protein
MGAPRPRGGSSLKSVALPVLRLRAAAPAKEAGTAGGPSGPVGAPWTPSGPESEVCSLPVGVTL